MFVAISGMKTEEVSAETDVVVIVTSEDVVMTAVAGGSATIATATGTLVKAETVTVCYYICLFFQLLILTS